MCVYVHELCASTLNTQTTRLQTGHPAGLYSVAGRTLKGRAKEKREGSVRPEGGKGREDSS